MTPENFFLIRDVVGALRRLVRAVDTDSTRMNRHHGVTGPQGIVLRSLYHRGPISSVELSRLLHVTPSNMTGLIDRLESKRLVKRIKKEGDRRVSMISLTPEGKTLSAKLPDPLEAKLMVKLADLDQQHVNRLYAALEELLSMIDAAGSETPASDLLQGQTDEQEHSNRHLHD